jgi:hypothetical protein
MIGDGEPALPAPKPETDATVLSGSETVLRLWLLRRILWTIVGLGVVLAALRFDRGWVVLGPTLLFFGLIAVASRLLRPDVR